MRLVDHITLNFNNNMLMAAVFLDIERAFDTIWHSDLLYKMSELEFSTSPIKLIASFMTDRKCKAKFSTPKELAAGETQNSVLASILYSLHQNDVPAAPGTCLALFSDQGCIYMTEKYEHYVLCKLQHCLTAEKSCTNAGT
jgi:hypothetical protein